MKAIAGTPFENAPPAIDTARAERIAFDYFGMTGRARLLSSERDANFRIETATGAWLLKVGNAAEDPMVTGLQTRMLLHLAKTAPLLPVPRLMPGIDGRHEQSVPIDDRAHIVRLMSFLPGASLADFPDRARFALPIVETLAAVDIALADLEDVAGDHPLLWDGSRPHQIRSLLPTIADREDLKLVETLLDRWENSVAARVKNLRHQLIHNDFNPCNILVEGDQVTGIIDFGDAVRAPLINDLATAAAYLMDDVADPIDRLAQLLSAYHARLPLDREEAALLYELVRSRWAITVAISNWRASHYPDNETYILRNGPVASRWLRATAGLDPDAVATRLCAIVATKEV